jgi:predicted HTH transcriptional regulator
MIDFANIEKYKENNRIEAKKAVGGLPHSIWETYSAFANALGGIILLGVEEHKDKSLHPLDLPDPESLIREFWYIVKNTNKVSSNILSDKDVTVEDIDGKRIVAIRIPRAQRSDKPVFIDGNALSGTYRRNGEGDYRCTNEEIQAMMRDAAIKTQDMTVLEDIGLDALDYNSVKRYRIRMKSCRPEHIWEKLEDVDFLHKLGAVGKADNGALRPTVAGLLMFGYAREIVKKFPEYLLDYQEQLDPNTPWTERIVSSSGDWSGNIYDFYFRVYSKITQNIEVSFKPEDCGRSDDTPVHKAIREALTNCLTNADYYGKQGIVIIKKKDIITLSNPGGFRIDVEAAKSGGVSDPRNSTLIKMFSLIDIGKRAGSGIPNIFRVWKKQGWPAPEIIESFEPDRITLSLPIHKGSNKRSVAKSGEKATKTKSQIQKQAIVTYLTEKITAKTTEVAELLGVKNTRARSLLAEMVAEEIIMTYVENKNRIYKLKE